MTQLAKCMHHAHYSLYSFQFLYKQKSNQQAAERLSAFQTRSLKAVTILCYQRMYVYNVKKLTAGSREMMRTVLSAKPTARKRHLCSPGGTFASAIHTASDGISLRSVYSLSCPVCKQTSTLYKRQQLHMHLNSTLMFRVHIPKL
jgi:hypothetical protein